MPSICGANFSIGVSISMDCTIGLTVPDGIEIRGTSRYNIVKDFTYTVGTDPDRNHQRYGFYARFSGIVEPAVSARFKFVPTTPPLTDDPTEVLPGRFEIVSIEIDEAQAQTLDSSNEPSITITLFLNTGY